MLNQVVQEAVTFKPPPKTRGGKGGRVFYCTQVNFFKMSQVFSDEAVARAMAEEIKSGTSSRRHGGDNILQLGHTYTSFVAPLVYAFMGSSRDIAIGPVVVVSLLLGTLLTDEINDFKSHEYLRLAFTATFFAGITQMALGILRLGFLKAYQVCLYSDLLYFIRVVS